ncbi:uncharacterized protein LOC62_03G003614 [Vanrija pseudolonga]|uniref:Uncharacterized protein n=1 Tax=Vanrija pseudolonga TaxID=143232 RepID=A0AAF0Y4F2_9TREE|nr:hypothetical protein LOC62_03G003614 [Vanrija pseudolonga]
MPEPPGKPLSEVKLESITPTALGSGATAHPGDGNAEEVGVEKNGRVVDEKKGHIVQNANNVITGANTTPQATTNVNNNTVAKCVSSPPLADQSQLEPVKGYEKFKRQREAYVRKFGEGYEKHPTYKKFLSRSPLCNALYQEEVNKNLKRKAEVIDLMADSEDEDDKVDGEARLGSAALSTPADTSVTSLRENTAAVGGTTDPSLVSAPNLSFLSAVASSGSPKSKGKADKKNNSSPADTPTKPRRKHRKIMSAEPLDQAATPTQADAPAMPPVSELVTVEMWKASRAASCPYGRVRGRTNSPSTVPPSASFALPLVQPPAQPKLPAHV